MLTVYNITALILLFVGTVLGRDPIIITADDHVAHSNDDCTNCRYTWDGFLNFVRSNASESMAKAALYRLCVMTSMDGPVACQGWVDIEFDTVYYIIKNRPTLNGSHVCAIYQQSLGCTDESIPDWTIRIDPNPIETNQSKIYSPETKPLKILSLTDIHFDPEYTPGRNSKCNMPLCCQKDSGNPQTSSDAAGYWGDYNVCDLPWHTLEASVNFIKQQHKDIDLVYFTGDIISHIGWKTTRKSNSNDIKKLYAYFKQVFGNIPVYPVLGNHEAHPSDFYSPESVRNETKISTQWLFDLVSEEWSRWLPPSAQETIKRGGFYTVLVKPKFRLIALNNNICYVPNLWLLYDDVDPFGQLQWLADTLKLAEQNGEFVHIISHVPPGEADCHKVWNREYVKIIKRFAHIVQAQFNGHTHYDEFRVFYDDSKNNVINVAYNGGSLTTFIGNNPNYKMYDVDGNNFEVQNYHTWMFNLTEANLNTKIPPKFYKLYSFVEDYNLGSLTYESVGKLMKDMDSNDSLKRQYYRYRERDTYNSRNGCDDACLQSLTCYIRGVLVEDTLKCKTS